VITALGAIISAVRELVDALDDEDEGTALAAAIAEVRTSLEAAQAALGRLDAIQAGRQAELDRLVPPAKP
jgi:hypothetical protein